MTTAQAIQEMRKKRFMFLRKCYEVSGGSARQIFVKWNVGDELGFDRELSNIVTEYLDGEGLIKYRTSGGGISITHRGIIEIEEALGSPDQPTEHFPPLNIIHVGQMIDSQIQQGSPSAAQMLIREDGDEQLQEAVNALRESLDQLSLDQQDISDLKTDMQTIEAQMSKSTPSRTIITESVLSIRRILEQVAGTAIGGVLLAQFNALVGG